MTGQRARTFLLSLPLYVAVYLLVLVSLSPGDLVVGALLAAGVLLVFRRVLLGRGERPFAEAPKRLLWLGPLLVHTAWQIAIGSRRVCWVILGLGAAPHPGLIELEVGERSEAGVAVTGFLTSLTPGSVLVDIDRGRDVMIFHFLDAGDAEATRRRLERSYQRYQRRVVP